jgi:hypothetical protein
LSNAFITTYYTFEFFIILLFFSVGHTTRDPPSTNGEANESENKYHYVTDEMFERNRFKVYKT